MKNHRIDIDNFKIEKAVKITILQMILQIEEKLQITEKLSPKERLSMVSCGEKRNAFVKKIIKVSKENLQLLPRTFNLNELIETYNLTQDLLDIIHEVNELHKQLYDYYMLTGSKSFKIAMHVKKQLEVVCKANTEYNNIIYEIQSSNVSSKKTGNSEQE